MTARGIPGLAPLRFFPRRATKPASGHSLRLAVVTGALGLLAFQILAIVLGGWPAFNGEFLGPDSYMRLNRVLECRGGLACPDGLYPDSNVPFGEALHWPFLQDWLLLGLAAPLRPFLGFRSAVIGAGYLFGPLMGILAVTAVIFAARPLISSAGLTFVGLLLALQLFVAMAFAPARPDHHGLQAVLFLAAAAAGIRLLIEPEGRGPPIFAGAMTGLALWISTEALITLAPLIVALSLMWLAQGGSDTARANRLVTLATASVLATGLLVDGPHGSRFAVEFDRFSIVHVCFFVLLTLFWWTVERSPGARSFSARLGWAALATAIISGTMVLAFPGIHRGPLADVDPLLLPIWLDLVAEYIPLLREGDPTAIVEALGPLVVGGPVTVWLAARGPHRNRGAWAFLLGFFVWFSALGLFHGVRWGYYLHVLVPTPLAWLLGELLRAARRIRWTVGVALVKVTLVVMFAAGPLLATSILLQPALASSPTATPPCRVGHLIPTLSALRQEADRPPVVLAPMSWGPEIVFRADHHVVATPYHRNAPGILDSHAIMSAMSPDQAWRLLASRRIGYLVTCRGRDWSPLVRGDQAGTLYAEMQRGRVPGWLRPVPLPEALAGGYAVWEVVQERGPEPTA
jgi:asparagine N-glycosylation enzyme membrane subunit Stt3